MENGDIGDGVALISAAHPRTPWWRRVAMFFRRPKLTPDNFETVEIEIPPQYEHIRIPIGTIWSKEDGKYVPLSSRPDLQKLSDAALDKAFSPVDKHGK